MNVVRVANSGEWSKEMKKLATMVREQGSRLSLWDYDSDTDEWFAFII